MIAVISENMSSLDCHLLSELKQNLGGQTFKTDRNLENSRDKMAVTQYVD
jgi:hypothetical protein